MNLAAHQRSRATGGFSLIELTVAVGLLTIVILALYSMFHQTQQAFHKALNQADTTEGVRSSIELIAADLQKAATPGIKQMINMAILPAPPVVGYGVTNRLALPGKDGSAANVLALNEILFSYQDSSNGWHTAGYLIGPPDGLGSAQPLEGVCSLYRFDDATLTNETAKLGAGRFGYGANPFPLRGNPTNLAFILGGRFTNLASAARTGGYKLLTDKASRVLDGVVYFKITALDSYGNPYIYLPAPGNTSYVYPPAVTNNLRYTTDLPPYQIHLSRVWAINQSLLPAPIPNESTALFFGTNLPAAIDIELGILDTQQTERFRVLPPPPAKTRLNFLANFGGQIVTLKQRVNLRNAPHSYQ
jgi:type II secretory pathway pseudopilin PulG